MTKVSKICNNNKSCMSIDHTMKTTDDDGDDDDVDDV